MPRHYTDDEKCLVLERLIANHGDVPRTAAECGINERNIYVWRKDSKFADFVLPNLKNPTNFPNHNPSSDSPSLYTERGQGGEVLPEETTQAFQILHDKLLAIADTLSNRIVEAIDDSSLSQRMTALSQLIDRIAKLAALLPEDDEPSPSGKPFEIDFDVDEEEDEYDEEEESDDLRPSAGTSPESGENSEEYSPF